MTNDRTFVTLAFTKAEAEALKFVLRRVGGKRPGPRSDTDNILMSLESVLGFGPIESLEQ